MNGHFWGETFEQLNREFPEATLSEVNEGKGLLLNEMESGWQYSVRRLEKPGDVTQRRPVSTPEGPLHFQINRKRGNPPRLRNSLNNLKRNGKPFKKK